MWSKKKELPRAESIFLSVDVEETIVKKNQNILRQSKDKY